MNAAEPLVSLIQEARFTTARFRPGYRTADVDDFLDEIVTLLQGTADPRRSREDAAARVREAAFATETFPHTYDMQDVDAFLEEVLLPALTDHHPHPAAPASEDRTLTAGSEDGQVNGTAHAPGASKTSTQGGEASFPEDEDRVEDPLIAQLRGARFPTASRFTVNYPVGEVDSLLDEMIAALEGASDRTSGRREARAVLVRGSLDRSRKARDSYRAEDVDMFLLEVYNRLQGSR